MTQTKQVAIPIEAAKRIAEEFGYDQVVIVGRRVGGFEHVTTYGKDEANCSVAARMGNFFKHKLMGWPKESPDPLKTKDVLAAIYAVGREAARRGEMFPQTSDEQREDSVAVRRVMGMIEWYERNTGCARIKDWPNTDDGSKS